jgi:cell division protein FtsQ
VTAATIGIDPRLRARRVAVVRAEGRRRLRILLALVGVATIVGAAWTLTQSAFLDVDQVRVAGAEGPDAELIRQTAGIVQGEALIDVDIAAVEARLATLPWVKDADVRRDWPGTLVVSVTERNPVAVLPSGTEVALLDEEGVVIGREPSSTDAAVAALPMIAVPLSVAIGEAELSAGPGLAVVAALTADLRPWVAAVLVDDGDVGIELVGGAKVTMGPPVRLDDKVSAVRAVLAGVDLACITTIDVIAPDQTTVRRDPRCDAAAQATVSDA